MRASANREIIIPHDSTRGPVTAVRRLLVQSSLVELKQIGVYDRYATLIDPVALQQISDSIGPGWLAIELAYAHYQAVDQLALPMSQITALGVRAGEKLQDSLFISNAKNATGVPAPWEAMGAFWRMGRRLWEGGSSQYVRLSPKDLQIENRGNPLFAIDYYRAAHAGFLRGSISTLGITVQNVKLLLDGDEAIARVNWL